MDFCNDRKRVVQRAIVSAVTSSLIAFNSFAYATTSEDYEKALTFNQNEYDKPISTLKTAYKKILKTLLQKS